MGKRRREKALESTLEQRIENRKLHPDNAFKNGGRVRSARGKLMRKQFRQRAFPGRLHFS